MARDLETLPQQPLLEELQQKGYTLTYDNVRWLASLGLSKKQIANYFGTTEALVNQLDRAYQAGKAYTQARIAQLQLQKALEQGDSKMLIFLGKNINDQREYFMPKPTEEQLEEQDNTVNVITMIPPSPLDQRTISPTGQVSELIEAGAVIEHAPVQELVEENTTFPVKRKRKAKDDSDS